MGLINFLDFNVKCCDEIFSVIKTEKIRSIKLPSAGWAKGARLQAITFLFIRILKVSNSHLAAYLLRK
jgi:hypothetical protein